MTIKIKNEFCERSIEIDNGSDEVIESKGFIDSHGHIMWLGMKNLGLDLEDTTSANEVLEKTKVFQIENPDLDWIEGRGWNNELWKNNEKVSLADIDRFFPDSPVFLKRVDGHAGWANSKALKLAKIDKNTPNPDGGFIIKDDNGKPTGLLIDNAMELVNKVIPRPSKDQLKIYILNSIDDLAKNGVIHTCDMDVQVEWYEAFRELAEENKLKIKIDQYYRGFDGNWQEKGLKPHRINNLNVCGVKFFADGALGSRGAALLDDYSDDPGNKGLFLIEKEELYKKSKEAAKEGFEIATHSIGDAANRMVLDVYERLRNDGIKNKLRIEHAQIVHPSDLNRFIELDIEAHIQPSFCTSDEKMAEKRLGDRVSYSYAWRHLIESGAKVFGGSDYPIESHNPLDGLESLLEPNIKWQEDKIPALKDALKIYEDYFSSSFGSL